MSVTDPEDSSDDNLVPFVPGQKVVVVRGRYKGREGTVLREDTSKDGGYFVDIREGNYARHFGRRSLVSMSDDPE
jgi:hypothetical protein